jgi:hypothetical protein
VPRREQAHQHDIGTSDHPPLATACITDFPVPPDRKPVPPGTPAHPLNLPRSGPALSASGTAVMDNLTTFNVSVTPEN